MNRIERISAILIQLQSKKVVKGQDIADRFKISLRTAYRDLKALEESGVPLVSEPGLGYSLMAGYRLPPVMFTKEEAIAFLTAEKLVEKLTDSATYQIYQSALFKIKAVLKSDDKEHLHEMNAHLEVIQNPYLPNDKMTSDHMQSILTSISNKVVLQLHYFALHNQENTQRAVEPVGMYLMGHQWYLIAYCLLRKDYRNFRLDRIQKACLTDLPFAKKHPPLKNYLKDITKKESDLKTVVLRINNSALKYLGEQKFYHGFVSEKQVRDQTEMTFLSCSLEGFARWYMMFGDAAQIISPNDLKIRVKEIMKEMVRNLK